MPQFEQNNAAKEWILTELGQRLPAAAKIVDLGCGDGHIWEKFAAVHPGIRIIGLDTDQQAIARGQERLKHIPRIKLHVFDAQKPWSETNVDAVVALSAIEHVVDRPAFLRTCWSLLKNGGLAYLNYDVGHFRSPQLRERLMAPISQLLAAVGIEGPYMKRVDDRLFIRQAETVGFYLEQVRKHNLAPIKGLMRGAGPEAIEAWYAFEARLGQLFSPERLDRAMYSTTLALRKP